MATMVLSLLGLSACGGAGRVEEIAVHPLPELTHDSESTTFSGEKFSIRSEYFVISGAADGRQKLLQAFKAFSSSTLSSEQLQKYFAYMRYFYRKTENTPRDYREENKGYFEHDRIDLHSDDLLVVKWTEFGKLEEYQFQ